MRQRLLVAAIGVPLTVVVILFAPGWLFSIIMAVLFCYCVYELLRTGYKKWYCWAVAPLIILAAACLIWQRYALAPYWLLLPVGCAYIGDAGAMLTGKFVGPYIGGGHPFPQISPKKTWAGVAGGLTVPVIYTFAFITIAGKTEFLPAWLLYGLILGIVTECGDLMFSYIKRKLGIKDYGTLLPGHGGVLDRFDSMILVAPVSLVLFNLAVTKGAIFGL